MFLAGALLSSAQVARVAVQIRLFHYAAIAGPPPAWGQIMAGTVAIPGRGKYVSKDLLIVYAAQMPARHHANNRGMGLISARPARHVTTGGGDIPTTVYAVLPDKLGCTPKEAAVKWAGAHAVRQTIT